MSRMDDVLGTLPKRLEDMTAQVEKLAARATPDLQADLTALHKGLFSSWDDVLMIMEQVERLQHLIRLSALITSSLELSQVLDDVLDTVIVLTGAERALILLTPIDSTVLQVYAARDWGHNTLSQNDFLYSQGIVDMAIQHRHPVVATDAVSDKRFDKRESIVANVLRSVIAVPLIHKDRLIGVLYGDNRMTRGVFNEDNYDLLRAFANQAAIAITNARLYEQVRHYLRESHQELLKLTVDIDQQAVQERVEQITQTDLFKTLQKFAQESKRGKPEDET